MTAPGARAVARRYHLLLALRYVPTGLSVTVFVLLLQDRGLSLAQIGLGMAAQGVVMLVLELPSGGLADALGRKPVAVLASGFGMVSLILLLVADSVALLAVVCTFQGIFRALDSGPLQAWYVDALLAADPAVGLERALGRADVTICSAIGGGSLVGGLVVAGGGIAGQPALVSPLVLALGVQAIGLVALALLVDEPRRGRGWRAARQAVREVPAVVGGATRVIRRSSLLAALVAAEALWGFGAIAFEVLMPPRLSEVSGGADQAAAMLGPALTAAWTFSALGSAVAPWLAGRFGPARTGLGLRLAHGATVAGMGVAAGPVGLVAAYVSSYGVHGATNTVHYAMVHRAVDGRHRATVVSANSLAAQVGGAASGIALGALADAASVTTAMLVAAGVLAGAGPLYLCGRRPAAPRAVEPAAVETAAVEPAGYGRP
jgi:MFS family permease